MRGQCRVIRALGALGLLNDGQEGVDEVTGETGFVIEAWAGRGKEQRRFWRRTLLRIRRQTAILRRRLLSMCRVTVRLAGRVRRCCLGLQIAIEFGAAVTFNPGDSRFEPGLVPGDTLTLSWDTFTQAADEGGLSRLYGGIHFEDGDVNGRQLGRDVGETVWAKIQAFADAQATMVSLFQPEMAAVTNGLAPADTDYELGFSFSEVTSQDGVSLLLSFSAGSAVLQEDFELSLAGSRNISEIERLDNGDVLISVEGGVSAAVLAVLPRNSRSGFKAIEARLVDGLGYRVSESDVLTMGLSAPSELEVLDLRNSAAEMVTAQVSVYSEAAYDNLIGFYRTNETGDVLDGQGNVVAAVGGDAYRQAVVDHSIAAQVASEGTHRLMFEGRSLLGTFLIADGSLDSYDLDRVYVSGIGNNADGSDHIQKIGDNVFAFEDMVGGGDQDFNDMIVSVRF